MNALKYALLMVILLPCSLRAGNADSSAKTCFFRAKEHLEGMLNGQESMSFEEAIYQIENAWWEGGLDHHSYTQALAFHTAGIHDLMNAYRDEEKMNPVSDLTGTKEQKIATYQKLLANYAIYQYMTNTALWLTQDKMVCHLPFSYSTKDPMGSMDWKNTHVSHLLNENNGNCFALASLFRIFSERFHSDARLCTAPSHIYIRHADDKGTFYNVELSSQAFPGTGTIETLTYTPDEATRNNIALRELNLKQSIVLCLVYLAKGYEHKFAIKEDEFMLACAETALAHDDHNLNAMLLKAEILENRLVSQGKDVKALQGQKTFKEYQLWITHIFKLGYREMPFGMKNILIKGWTRDTIMRLAAKDHTPASPDPKLQPTRYASLSWGLFDEQIRTKPLERFGNTVFDTKKQAIVAFLKSDILYNQYSFDPVVFAWNVDPLAHKFPSHSPYSAMGGNPIWHVDPTGAAFVVADKAQQATILGYIREQLGIDAFSFKQGKLRVNQKAYDAGAVNFDDNKRAIGDGLIKIAVHPKIIEGKLFSSGKINFSRNPSVPQVSMQYDPDMGRNVPTPTAVPMFNGKGVELLEMKAEAITFSIWGKNDLGVTLRDDRAFMFMNTAASQIATFNAENGASTKPCASCIMIHELLDHGMKYLETGDVPKNDAAGVEHHNRSLQNMGSPTRTGSDHTNSTIPSPN